MKVKSVPFEKQKALPVNYKGVHLDLGYRLDILVDNLVIVEIKATERIEPIHEAQLLTYLKIKRLWLGLLINFNIPVLRDGIKRIG